MHSVEGYLSDKCVKQEREQYIYGVDTPHSPPLYVPSSSDEENEEEKAGEKSGCPTMIGVIEKKEREDKECGDMYVYHNVIIILHFILIINN